MHERLEQLEQRVIALEYQARALHCCWFCGATEFLTAIPYGSKYDGKYICGECLDQAIMTWAAIEPWWGLQVDRPVSRISADDTANVTPGTWSPSETDGTATDA